MKPRTLRFENLERKQLLAVVIGDTNGDGQETPADIVAVGNAVTRGEAEVDDIMRAYESYFTKLLEDLRADFNARIDSIIASLAAIEIVEPEPPVIEPPVVPTPEEVVIVTDDEIVTHHDRIPRFAGPNTDAVVVTESGLWSELVTNHDGKIRIAESAIVVIDEDITADSIEVSGDVWIASGSDITVTARDITVMPGGDLRVMPNDDVTHKFIFSGNLDDDDLHQFGRGLLVFGKLHVEGTDKVDFSRLVVDAKAGDRTIIVGTDAVGWKVGDRIVIPDTRQIAVKGFIGDNHTGDIIEPTFVSQAEERTIVSLFEGIVTLDAPLEYDHLGSVHDSSLKAHVGNRTRNVIFRSENDLARGHILATARADFTFRNAAVVNMGRTVNQLRNSPGGPELGDDGNPIEKAANQVGRYPIHLHRLLGPINPDNTGHQFEISGSVIDGYTRWGIALHESSYGLVESNFVYAAVGDYLSGYNVSGGAGIATESGDEVMNTINKNFILSTKAGTTQKLGGNPTAGGSHPNKLRDGESRDGIWLRGAGNIVTNNVVANASDIGININSRFLADRVFLVPAFRGGNPMIDGEAIVVRHIDGALPPQEHSGNEVYGATNIGFWTEQVRTQDQVYSDFTAWNVSDTGAYIWGEDTGTIYTRFRLFADPAVSAQAIGWTTHGASFGDTYYSTPDVIIEDWDVRGWSKGVVLPFRGNRVGQRHDETIVQGGYFENAVNFEHRLSRFSAYGHTNRIENVTMKLLPEAMPIQGGTAKFDRLMPDEPTNVFMNAADWEGHTFLVARSELWLDAERIYFAEQAPDYIIPPYRPRRGGLVSDAPGVGLTNAEAWEQLGIAVAGSVAPEELNEQEG